MSNSRGLECASTTQVTDNDCKFTLPAGSYLIVSSCRIKDGTTTLPGDYVGLILSAGMYWPSTENISDIMCSYPMYGKAYNFALMFSQIYIATLTHPVEFSFKCYNYTQVTLTVSTKLTAIKLR